MRLNKTTKQAIITSALAAFDATQPYNGEFDAEICKTYQKIMKGLFDSTYGHLSRSFKNKDLDGFLTQSPFTVKSRDGRYEEYSVLPIRGKRQCVDLLLTGAEWDLIFADLIKLMQVYSDFKKHRTELRNKLTNLIEPHTTSTTLLKIWPECEQFIPTVSTVRSLAVVTDIMSINRELGL